MDLTSIILSAVTGGVIALSFASITKAWKHAKEVNDYRELLMNFIERIGIPLSKEYIVQASEAIAIIQCEEFKAYREMVHGRSAESFPMLNSDLLRSIPPVMLKEILDGRTAFSEIFIFYHCLDFVMEVTPGSAQRSYNEFVKEHTKDKVSSHDDFIREFEQCEIISTQRHHYSSLLKSRIKRSELNIGFLKSLHDELAGSGLKWRLRYFWKALI